MEITTSRLVPQIDVFLLLLLLLFVIIIIIMIIFRLRIFCNIICTVVGANLWVRDPLEVKGDQVIRGVGA
jgi:hypothetical protein